MIDVAIAIDAESGPLVWGSKTGAWNDAGEWVAGPATETNIRGWVQPAKGTHLLDLPEGLRAEARWLLWTRTAVQLDDVIKDGAFSYRVMFVWPRREGVFTRAAIGLLK